MPRFDQTVTYAWNGVLKLIRGERQFRIIMAVMIIVLITGYALDFAGQHLNRYEWVYRPRFEGSLPEFLRVVMTGHSFRYRSNRVEGDRALAVRLSNS